MRTMGSPTLGQGVSVQVGGLYEARVLQGSAALAADLPGLVLVPPRATYRPAAEWLKRGFDLVVACAMVVLTLPFALTIAAWIWFTSAGPILFRQTRVGRSGQRFLIFKFRTMVEDADRLKAGLCSHSEADGLFKIREDPRLTPVGRVLRQTYLDELPQLINVLRGEMSIVGPRPLIIEEDAMVTGSGRERLALRPGMTGEWQLLRGGGGSLDEMIAADFRYVTEWTLWRDVLCIAKTAVYMFSRKGW